jgi:hypothetical protein
LAVCKILQVKVPTQYRKKSDPNVISQKIQNALCDLPYQGPAKSDSDLLA